MKTVKKRLLFSMICMILFMTTAAAFTIESQAAAKKSCRKETIKVLFVGNSLTKRNNMPTMFREIAQAGGFDVYTDMVWGNGYTLDKFANRKTATGAAFYRKLRSQEWDYVVLQEQSTRPLLNPTAMKKAVKTLSNAAHQSGAEVVLYMTWAQKTGGSFYSTSYAKKNKMTQRKFQRKLYDIYNTLGEENNALVANAGVGFYRCQQYYKSIALYVSDQRHPTKEGSYLAACTIYDTIFQRNAPFEDCGIPRKTASNLRRIANRVTFTSAGELEKIVIAPLFCHKV